MKELLLTDKENNIIKLSGEIDVVNADNFYKEIEIIYNKNNKNLEFDLSNLKFLDSTALGTFVKLSNLLKKDGNKIIIKNSKEQIKKLFLICQLDSVMDIEA